MSAASVPLHAPRVAHMQDTPDADVDMDDGGESEMDEEIDQLDSDTDDEVPVATLSAPARPKARQKKPAERVPGQVLLPLDRLENILEPDGAGIHMSKEAYFMLAAATEAFIKRLASAGFHHASSERRTMINYRDLSSLPVQYREFTFLQETMPRPISLSEALERRAAKEKEVIDPSASTSAVPSPSPSTLPGFTPVQTPTPSIAGDIVVRIVDKTKGRQTNGKAKGGSAASVSAPRASTASQARGHNPNGKPVARRQSTREPKPRRRPDEDDDAMVIDEQPSSASSRIANSRARARERTSKSKAVDDPVSGDGRHSARKGPGHGASVQNGSDSLSSGVKHKPTMMPQLPHGTPYYSNEHHAAPHGGEGGQWSSAVPTHPTVSLSGQFGGSGMSGAFAKNGLLDNPGRTIYSEQRPPDR